MATLARWNTHVDNYGGPNGTKSVECSCFEGMSCVAREPETRATLKGAAFQPPGRVATLSVWRKHEGTIA